MLKLNSVSNLSNSRATMAVAFLFLALLFFVSVLPQYSLNSQAASVSLRLTPVVGKVGATVAATGKGFFPGSTVTLKFGTKTVGTTKANSTGGINTHFVVPQNPSGKFSVFASDGSADSTHATFTIPAPAPHISP